MFNLIKNKNVPLYEKIIYSLENYDSTNEEINMLLNKFYNKVYKLDDSVIRVRDNNKIKLKSDIKNGNKIMREVYIGDLIIYVVFKLLYETIVINTDDEIAQLIYEIYTKIDKVVHPYQDNKDSDIDLKYYVEINYEEE